MSGCIGVPDLVERGAFRGRLHWGLEASRSGVTFTRSVLSHRSSGINAGFAKVDHLGGPRATVLRAAAVYAAILLKDGAGYIDL